MIRRDWLLNRIRKSAKIDEGSISPLWFLILQAFFHPVWFIRWQLAYQVSSLKYDLCCDTIEIYGVRYSRQLFMELGIRGMPEGALFRLVKRENKTIVLKRVLEVVEVYWDCPGCRYRITNEQKEGCSFDYDCSRCGKYKWSQFEKKELIK